MTQSTGESMGKLVEKKTGKSGKRSTEPRSSRSKELSPAGTKIVSAFQEAIDVMRSGKTLPGRLTVRSCHTEFVRPAYGPEDVRRVRDLLGMSQVVFARFLGVDPNTVRSWEQGTRHLVPSLAGSWERSRRIRRIGDSGLHIRLWTEPSPL